MLKIAKENIAMNSVRTGGKSLKDIIRHCKQIAESATSLLQAETTDEADDAEVSPSSPEEVEILNLSTDEDVSMDGQHQSAWKEPEDRSRSSTGSPHLSDSLLALFRGSQQDENDFVKKFA